jgi:hypothetical protein
MTSILLMLFLCLPISCADPSVTVSDYELSPEVFMPGDTGILTLTIYNAETTATETTVTVTTTTVETHGAMIQAVWISSVSDGDKQVKSDLRFQDIGVIAPGGSIPISFELTAEENITEDWYFPKVKIDLENSRYEDAYYPIPVRVSNLTVDLISKEVPSKISVGGSTEITLTAINNREGSVDGVTITPSSNNEIDFMPESVFVGSLASETSQDVSFSLIPSEIGTYNLSFIISFKNGDNLHNQTLTIPIEVIETLDVAPVIYSVPSSVGKGQKGRARLEVYNAKTESISGVIVTPVTNVKVTPSQYFIGAMDPDDVFSASFEIDTNNLDIGENYSIDFKVSFKQGDNYYETPSVSSTFSVVEACEKTSNNLGLTIALVIVILILVLILYFNWRKRRRPR